MHISGAHCIEIGENLLTVARRSSLNANDLTKITLEGEQLINLSRIKGIGTAKYLFGRKLFSNENWSLDLVHKIKPNTEILHMSLKQDGSEVMNGAYSKTNKNGRVYSKFHFTEGDIYLTTGETTKYGTLAKQRKKFVLPEKYYDYLWCLKERKLQILADLFGICGETKTVEEMAEKWGVKTTRIREIRENSLLVTKQLVTHNWRKPIGLTEKNHYSIFDYIRALRYIKEKGADSSESEKANSVILEWRLERAKNS